ncbi:MAG: PorT family protein [Chitinophagaceae bacterium]|nr:PorT family protein [Chitinophagaceae bacterium]
MAKVELFIITVFFIGLNLCTVYGKAQDYDEQTFIGGVSLGANFAQVDGDNFAGYHKPGLNGGLIVFSKLSTKTALGLELTYSQKGSRAGASQLPRKANDQNTILTDYRIQLNYLEVPLYLSYFDKRRNNIGAGLAYGQLVRSKETYRNESGTVYENDAKLFPFRKFDLSYVINGSLQVYKNLFINMRFSYSLVKIRSSYNYITGRPEQFNNVYTLRLQYLF